MPQDNFGRVIPAGFAGLPVAMKAECLALLAERAREAGDRRRLTLIESRMHLYARAALFKLPDAQTAPAPERMTRETAWNTSAYSYAEVQSFNRMALHIVGAHWPHCDPARLRPRVLRMLAFVAEAHGDNPAPVYAYDLARAFGVAEEVLTVPLREAAEFGFLIRNDEFSWFVSPAPPSFRASRESRSFVSGKPLSEGAPARPRSVSGSPLTRTEGSDGRSALRPSGGEAR